MFSKYTFIHIFCWLSKYYFHTKIAFLRIPHVSTCINLKQNTHLELGKWLYDFWSRSFGHMTLSQGHDTIVRISSKFSMTVRSYGPYPNCWVCVHCDLDLGDFTLGWILFAWQRPPVRKFAKGVSLLFYYIFYSRMVETFQPFFRYGQFCHKVFSKCTQDFLSKITNCFKIPLSNWPEPKLGLASIYIYFCQCTYIDGLNSVIYLCLHILGKNSCYN